MILQKPLPTNLWKLGKSAISQHGDVAQKFMDTVTEEEDRERERN